MTIETKYNYGDTVWFMYNNKPLSNAVTRFEIDCSYKGGDQQKWGTKTYPIVISYSFTMLDGKLVGLNENNCFPTKEALLQSL
jgi:hypothetical protein